MVKLVHLLLQGGAYLIIAVAENVAPPGADDVYIFLSIHIIKFNSLRMIDDYRREIFIVLHLRSWMPNMRQVSFYIIHNITFLLN